MGYSWLQRITIAKVHTRIAWLTIDSLHGMINMDALGVLELAEEEA